MRCTTTCFLKIFDSVEFTVHFIETTQTNWNTGITTSDNCLLHSTVMRILILIIYGIFTQYYRVYRTYAQYFSLSLTIDIHCSKCIFIALCVSLYMHLYFLFHCIKISNKYSEILSVLIHEFSFFVKFYFYFQTAKIS